MVIGVAFVVVDVIELSESVSLMDRIAIGVVDKTGGEAARSVGESSAFRSAVGGEGLYVTSGAGTAAGGICDGEAVDRRAGNFTAEMAAGGFSVFVREDVFNTTVFPAGNAAGGFSVRGIAVGSVVAVVIFGFVVSLPVLIVRLVIGAIVWLLACSLLRL